MLVKDIMVRNPFTAKPDNTVPEVKALMKKQKVNKMPILDEYGKLVGIVTKNDIEKATPNDSTTLDVFELSYLLGKLKIEEIMHKDVKFVTENETLENAASIMQDYGIGCLPVLKDNKIIGIITETDIFHAFIELFGARYPGVRVTFAIDEKPGQLAKIATGIAGLNGNIITSLHSDAKDDLHRMITLKCTGVSLEEVKNLVEACGGEIEDIRSV